MPYSNPRHLLNAVSKESKVNLKLPSAIDRK